jgi:hypothetical protein
LKKAASTSRRKGVVNYSLFLVPRGVLSISGYKGSRARGQTRGEQPVIPFRDAMDNRHYYGIADPW